MSRSLSREGVTLGQVAAVALVVGGLSTILWLVWERTGRLIPEPPLLAAALFAVLVTVVLWAAWPVRSYLRGRGHVEPLRAARALVFAQAGALTGAAAAGWYAAQLALVVVGHDLVAYQDRTWRVVLLTTCAILLAAAGLWAQSWCRLDPPRDDENVLDDER